MKKSKTCPKCGSKDIYYAYKVPTGGSPSANLGIQHDLVSDMQGIIFEAFICRKCGYIEFYVPADKLKNLK
jgi:predicted nucleic-acid-binding Zn-ribbon protein